MDFLLPVRQFFLGIDKDVELLHPAKMLPVRYLDTCLFNPFDIISNM